MNLIEKLKEAGITDVAVIRTDAIKSYPDIYSTRKEGSLLSGLEPDFTNQEGINVFMKPWKHIVGVVIPYKLLPDERKPMKDALSSISIMAWEWDYHLKIKDLIVKALGEDYTYQLHIDQGPLPERYLAMKMGLADGGRSQMLIHPQYGSAFHLAFVLTSLENEVEVEFQEQGAFTLSSHCKGCRLCQTHCPTKALSGEMEFDGKLCISAITQKKGLLTDWEMKSMGRQLYGCDFCQLSCPANSPLSNHKDNILPNRASVNRLNPFVLLEATQKSFVRDFGHMGFSWRGLGLIKRNALINLGNYGNIGHLEVLERLYRTYESSGNELLSKTAHWAIIQIKERHHRKGT